jgi:hypothetical protein
MDYQSWTKSRVLGIAVVAMLMSSGCAVAPRADGPFIVEAGSTWTYERRDTGSFGKGTVQLTNKALGEQTWQGRRVRATESPQGTRLTDAVTGDWLAMVKGNTTLITWEPSLGYDWPLTVGKSFPRDYRIVMHMTKQSFDIRSTTTVESFEEVTVPAGTFKTFKVRYTDSLGTESVNWYSPDGAGWVKIRATRDGRFPSGPGTQEFDLLSYSIKKN